MGANWFGKIDRAIVDFANCIFSHTSVRRLTDSLTLSIVEILCGYWKTFGSNLYYQTECTQKPKPEKLRDILTCLLESSVADAGRSASSTAVLADWLAVTVGGVSSLLVGVTPRLGEGLFEGSSLCTNQSITRGFCDTDLGG